MSTYSNIDFYAGPSLAVVLMAGVTFPIVSADEFAQKLECEPIYLKDSGIRSNLPHGPERKGKGGKVKRW